jgi:DNA ligase (NAD+)
LVEAGILTVSDVFEAADDSVEFEDILDCSSTVAFKLIARLSIARNIDMDKLICSFGAPKIGPSISMQIARSIKSIEQLAEMTEEALLAAVNGNKNSRRYAKSFAKFFGSEDVKTELNRLISCGVTTEKTAAGILSGYTVVLTGKFTTKRSELEDVVKRHGGSISPIIKNNTKLLIEGEKPSLAKIKRATELNVSILSEKELKELLS